MNDSLSIGEMDFGQLTGHEWLATNGLGGYACSTIPGANTRKYHGLLVAAMSPPVRRMVLLSRVEETLVLADGHHDLSSNEYPGVIHPKGHELLRAFSHVPFPRWAWQGGGRTLEKQLRLLPGENTVVLTYTLLGGDGDAELELRPLFALRPMHELTFQWNAAMTVERRGKLYRITPTSRTPEVFFSHAGIFDGSPLWYLNTIYRREEERGYSGLEDLWCPGVVRLTLSPGRAVHFVCSADPIDLEQAVRKAQQLAPPAAGEAIRLQSPTRDENLAAHLARNASDERSMSALLRAAGQFRVRAPRDGREATPACASGYPWPAPSGREALIGFTGIYLVPGLFAEALALLQALAAEIRDGLLPSEFPEDGSAPVYQGADVSLWFINAIHHYFRCARDEAGTRPLLNLAARIVEAYRHGTDLGISADSEGLLVSHAPGIPTTWMNAKIGDWVITPRAGRPVELNALWYNAQCIVAELGEKLGLGEAALAAAVSARLTQHAFNRRFWHDRNGSAGYCYDVVSDHGNDPSIRPNQLLALSLPFPVLRIDRHASVLELVRKQLLTPMGIRTLAPTDAGYRGRSAGNIHFRDRAYHGGSAYPWLLGAYVTALLRVKGRGEAARSEARGALEGSIQFLRADGLGQLCELFDGDAPHLCGGAIASAAAVGEILRAFAEDLLDLGPSSLVGLSQSITDLAKIRPASNAENRA